MGYRFRNCRRTSLSSQDWEQPGAYHRISFARRGDAVEIQNALRFESFIPACVALARASDMSETAACCLGTTGRDPPFGDRFPLRRTALAEHP